MIEEYENAHTLLELEPEPEQVQWQEQQQMNTEQQEFDDLLYEVTYAYQEGLMDPAKMTKAPIP